MASASDSKSKGEKPPYKLLECDRIAHNHPIFTSDCFTPYFEPKPTKLAISKKQKEKKTKLVVRERKVADGAYQLNTAQNSASSKVKLLLNKVPMPHSEIIRPGKRTIGY